MVTITPNTKSYKDIIDNWKQLPTAIPETTLQAHFVYPLLQSLNLTLHQIKTSQNLGNGAGLIPDILVYTDLTKPPALVIELKKRVANLATASDRDFF